MVSSSAIRWLEKKVHDLETAACAMEKELTTDLKAASEKCLQLEARVRQLERQREDQKRAAERSAVVTEGLREKAGQLQDEVAGLKDHIAGFHDFIDEWRDYGGGVSVEWLLEQIELFCQL